jgi:hypothetical protein
MHFGGLLGFLQSHDEIRASLGVIRSIGFGPLGMLSFITGAWCKSDLGLTGRLTASRSGNMYSSQLLVFSAGPWRLSRSWLSGDGFLGVEITRVLREHTIPTRHAVIAPEGT